LIRFDDQAKSLARPVRDVADESDYRVAGPAPLSLKRRALLGRIEHEVHQGAREDEVVARWAARYGSPVADADGRSLGWLGWFNRGLGPRLAVAFAAALLVVVGACVLPTSYYISLGLAVEITTDAELPHAEIAEFARAFPVPGIE